jgi:hypothetical protein
MSVIEQQRFITALKGGMIGSVEPTALTADVLDPLKDVLKRDLNMMFENTKRNIEAAREAAGGRPAAAALGGGGGAAAAAAKWQLSINRLDFNVSWIKLGLEFSKAGTVRFAKTIGQTGCAVVEFATEGEANYAKKEFDKNKERFYKELGYLGNAMRPSVNKLELAVFVTNCSWSTVDDIAKHFRADKACVVPTKRNEGFRVSFGSQLEAEEAIKKKSLLLGRKIYVHWNHSS